MKKQVITLCDRTYGLHGALDDNLALLANFLTDDLKDFFLDGYRKWIKYSSQQTVSANRSFLDKHEGMIYIRDLYDDDCGILEDRFLIISPDNLLAIIDHWEKLCKTKPAQITIVMDDNGYIQLVPSNRVDEKK